MYIFPGNIISMIPVSAVPRLRRDDDDDGQRRGEQIVNFGTETGRMGVCDVSGSGQIIIYKLSPASLIHSPLGSQSHLSV